MNATCPHCETTYRVDPDKIPAAGVRARCAECRGVFRVDAAPAAETEAPSPTTAAPTVREAEARTAVSRVIQPPAASPPEPANPPGPVSAPVAPPPFGAPDPQAKARRLARALISDIVVYHPERRERSLADGSLRQEFRDEIQKSWEEYVSQVGNDLARQTPHFREALNEILAGGARVF